MIVRKQKSTIPHALSGFTLLELLLVVVILSAVAFMAMSTVGNNMSQVRYEDTRNRLNAIRTAILGPSSPELWAKGYISGYIADNGRLPGDINALVQMPTDYDSFQAVTPIYKEGQTGEITLPTSFQMIKGHRGSYLSGAIDDIIRDGWGTSGTADFATNHGWDVTATATTFQVNSFGMDGQPNQLTGDPYEEDVAMSPSIFAEDWQVDVSGASVRVINRTSVNINLGSAVSFTAALLVYQNDTTSSWQTVETLTTDVTSLDNGNGLDNASAAWGESQDFVVTFPTGSTNIPVGEHLLVLVAGNDPDLRNNGIGTSPNYVTTRVKFYPRGGVPDMVLEIR